MTTTKRKTITFDLGEEAIQKLHELALKKHTTPKGGNATATLREIIRKAHREEFGSAKPQH